MLIGYWLVSEFSEYVKLVLKDEKLIKCWSNVRFNFELYAEI